MTNATNITRERIAAMEPRIRPFVRHTPVLRVDMADFGKAPLAVDLKLECLQHSGSFMAPRLPMPRCGSATRPPSSFPK
jgi:threonine dehydratase